MFSFTSLYIFSLFYTRSETFVFAFETQDQNDFQFSSVSFILFFVFLFGPAVKTSWPFFWHLCLAQSISPIENRYAYSHFNQNRLVSLFTRLERCHVLLQQLHGMLGYLNIKNSTWQIPNLLIEHIRYFYYFSISFNTKQIDRLTKCRLDIEHITDKIRFRFHSALRPNWKIDFLDFKHL